MSWRPVDHGTRLKVQDEVGTTFMIEAGAGTGKTELMVYRVASILRTGAATIDELVVITFTDAAAAEISARTREALQLLLHGSDAEVAEARMSPLDAEERPRVAAALGGIHRAHISTIHSFASSMLRERPVEARVDPAFRALDAIESAMDFDRAFAAWLDRMLDNTPPELAVAMAQGIGVRQLKMLALWMNLHRSVLPLSPFRPSKPDVRGFVTEAVAGRDPLADTRDHTGDDDRGRRNIDDVLEFLDQIDELSRDEDDTALIRAILLQAPDVKQSARERQIWDDEDAWRDARDIRKKLAGELEDVRNNLGEWILCAVLPVIEEFVLGYAIERRQMGIADYDDLLMWSRELLEVQAARDYFRRRFRRIIVDEFQDTDPIQADIVLCLAGDGDPPDSRSWASMAPRPGVLTVVGDPKQSIYRFRRADLAIYDHIKDDVMADHQAVIRQNFRSREYVIEWVNRVFGQAFVPEKGRQPANTELVHAPRKQEIPDDVPAVHVAWGVSHDEADDIRAEEGRVLAQALIHAHQSRWPVFDKATRTVRPVTWGDMVVLVPVWTKFDFFRDQLRAWGIPYRLGGGTGFFRRDEVADLCHLLEAIDDPLNDVAVVASLRSPMFGCSDEDLLLAAGTGRGINYRQRPTKECPPQVADAIALIRDLHDAMPTMTMPDIVRLAVERSLLVEQALAMPGDEQAAANLLKVADMARRFADARIGRGLGDFTRWLREQRELEEDPTVPGAREPDAGIADAGDDVVRVMTIHASKGLEFPVVAMANMSCERKMRSGPVPDRENGRLHLSVKGRGGSPFATPGFKEQWEAEKACLRDEFTRLMYVATTRARDHLIVPLATDAPHSTALINVVWSELPTNDPVNVGVKRDDGVEVIPPAALEAITPPGAVDIGEAEGALVDAAQTEREQWASARAALVEHASTELRQTAATQHDRDETPADEPPNLEDEDLADPVQAEDDERPAALVTERRPRGSDTEATRKGKALHLVMELIDYAAPADLDATVRNACATEDAAGFEDEVRAWVDACLGSNAVRRSLAADDEHREVPFTISLDGGESFEVGRIDLLIREGTSLTVVDWKSDRVEAGQEQQHTEAHHRGQADAYVRALRASLPDDLHVGEVVFVYARTGGEGVIRPEGLF